MRLLNNELCSGASVTPPPPPVTSGASSCPVRFDLGMSLTLVCPADSGLVSGLVSFMGCHSVKDIYGLPFTEAEGHP